MIPQEGPPPVKGHRKKAIEQALSEPQMIKRTMLSVWFQAARFLADIRFYKRMGKDTSRLEARVEREVIDLFLMMSNKEQVKGMADFKEWKTAICGKADIAFQKVYDLFYFLGDAFEVIGITKIEFLRSAPPGEDFREDEFLGDDQ
jgi:hypothetical protein